MKKTKIIYLLIVMVMMVACVKEPEEVPQNNIEELNTEQTGDTSNFYILHEGLWNQNNSSISYFLMKDSSIHHKVFENANGRKLGDTGNDIAQYGSQVFVIVSGSNTLEVFNANTQKSIEHISLLKEDHETTPRRLFFHQNYCFVSCFDGTIAQIDTTSLVIEKWITVGRNPEGITSNSEYLFVANSGGLSYPNYDTTISIISTNTWEESFKINVHINPNSVFRNSKDEIYVLSRGNHTSILSELQKLNITEKISKKLNLSPNQAFQKGDSLLLVIDNKVQIFDMLQDQIVDTDFLSTNQFETLTHIAIHPQTKAILCLDGNGYTKQGILYWYDQNKQLINTYSTGVLPSKILFTN